jgi:hypothetical protein
MTSQARETAQGERGDIPIPDAILASFRTLHARQTFNANNYQRLTGMLSLDALRTLRWIRDIQQLICPRPDPNVIVQAQQSDNNPVSPLCPFTREQLAEQARQYTEEEIDETLREIEYNSLRNRTPPGQIYVGDDSDGEPRYAPESEISNSPPSSSFEAFVTEQHPTPPPIPEEELAPIRDVVKSTWGERTS